METVKKSYDLKSKRFTPRKFRVATFNFRLIKFY